MGLRRILAAAVGTLQAAIGISAVIFAFILYFDFFDVQTGFNVPGELLRLYFFALTVFGFFSIISGLFLIHEGLESR